MIETFGNRIEKATNMLSIIKKKKYRAADGNFISLDEFVQESLDGIEMGTIESIITRETTKIGDTPKANIVKTKDEDIIESIIRPTENGEIPTLVIPVYKKEFINGIGLDAKSVLGQLLRSSTLPLVYNEIKKEWKEMCAVSETASKILYVPGVRIIYDFSRTHKNYLNNPIPINVLIVAVSSPKEFKKETADIKSVQIIQKIIADEIESAVRLGVKNFFNDPYSCRVFKKNDELTINAWSVALESDRVLDNFKLVQLSHDINATLIISNLIDVVSYDKF